MQVANKNNKCFIVWNNKIEGRLDPAFYIFPIVAGKDIFPIEKFAKVQGGFAFKSNEYLDKGIPLVRIQNIKDNSIDLYDTEFIDEKYKIPLSQFLLEENDILIAMTGATIGKIGKVSKNNLPAFLNQRVGRFVFYKETKINKNYLYYILQFSVFQNQIKKLSLGGAQPNISPNSIEKIKIPIPPLEIQNKIVEIMQSAYEKKTNKEKEAENILNSIEDYVLEELGIKILVAEDKKNFCINYNKTKGGRLDPSYYQPKFIELERAIKETKYNTKSLNEVVEFISGYAFKSGDYINKGIPLLRIQNITDWGISFDSDIFLPNEYLEKYKRFKLLDRDILISMTGAKEGAGSVGKIAINNKKGGGLVNQRVGILRIKSNEVNDYYLYSYLKTKIFRTLLIRNSVISVQVNASEDDILKILIPIPPLKIQNKIAEEVKNKIEKAQRLNSEAKNEVERAKQEVEKIILGK